MIISTGSLPRQRQSGFLFQTMRQSLPVFAVSASLLSPVPGALASQQAASASSDAAVVPQDPPASPRFGFNFKGQSYDQILDYFSRTTGWPVVRETDVPVGTVDYISPRDYSLDEALQTLNILLQTQHCMLRAEGGRLFLQKLDDMKRENVPTYVGTLPVQVSDDTIVTVVLPLLNAQAKGVAEQLKNLVASYGSVTALEQQNAVLLVETAAQVRRLQRIIDELDRKDVENIIELIPLRHAKASELLTSLTALMGERVIEYVINAGDGKRTKVEENRVAGLVLAADDRTNSIVARGSRAKIDQVQQTIELLDVPALGGATPTAAPGRGMKTLALTKVEAVDAKSRLEQLFAGYPPEKRPTVVALPEARRVTLVGSLESIDDAERFISEMEGFTPKPGSVRGERLRGDRSVAAIPLKSATSDTVLQALKSLLTSRQQSDATVVSGPDGRTILVSADSADISGIREIVAVLDLPANVERQVRLLKVASPQPEATVARARELFEAQTPAADVSRSIRIELDPASRELVLIGCAQSIERFSTLLTQLEQHRPVDRETRVIEVKHVLPSAIASQVASLAKQMLDPRDGTTLDAPTVDAMDATRSLIVSASPDQFATLQSLIQSLDRVAPGSWQVQTIPLAGIDPAKLLERADKVFAVLAQGAAAGELERPTLEADTQSGMLILSGKRESVAAYQQALQQARQLMPPPRAGKMISVTLGKASEIAPKLAELVAKSTLLDPSRAVQNATIEVVDATNTIFVVGEPAQIAMLESFVRELDVSTVGELQPMRLLQLRAGDAPQLAAMLQARFEQRSPEERRLKPLKIEADATTNTLVVSAHPELFDSVREFVEQLNRAGDTSQAAARETFVVGLKAAKAADLAIALDRLFPTPPMPLDSRGRPLPHLQKPKEVFVAADPTTNSLIVEAPKERRNSFESLVTELDRIPLPPQATLRTYRVERGDLEKIATNLRDLAVRGMLSMPAENGGKTVEVLVQTSLDSRTLIVAGDETTFEKTEELLEQLQAVPVRTTLRVIDALALDPSQLAARVTKLLAAEAPEGSTPGVVIEVDAANGTILVSGPLEATDRFALACDEVLRAQAPAANIRVIPLQYAKAAEAKLFLDGMAQGRLGSAAGFAREPIIDCVEKTNSLLIAASETQHQLLASLLKSIDVQSGTAPPIRILQLRTADASVLAQALSSTYAQRSLEDRSARPVSITAEPQTNAIIVSAHAELLPEIEAVIADLNDANKGSADDREIRIFPLAVARAAELAKTLDEMFPQPTVPVDPRGRPRPELAKPREVVVRADAQMNALIVDAPIARMPGFAKLVEQLDGQKESVPAEIRTWKIADGSLDAMAATLRELAQASQLGPGSAQAVISTEPVSKTLVVSGPPDIFVKVESVVKGVQGASVPATTLRVFKLKLARAEQLAALIEQTLSGRLAQIEPGLRGEGARALDVAADRRSNTIIVSAPDVLMPVAEALIAQLDAPASGVGNGSAQSAFDEASVRVRPLQYADASGIAQSLTLALASAVNPATGELVSVKVMPASGTNALLLVGRASDLEIAEKLIAELDSSPSLDAVDARTFPLKHADAAKVAPLVQRLLADQQEADPRIVLERMRRNRGQPDATPPVRVEADPRTNSLIVSGASRIMIVAEGLITQLDSPGDLAEQTWFVYTPAKADARSLAEQATRVLERTGASGVARKVELSVPSGSATVLIVGSKEEAERAKSILASLDAEAFAAPSSDVKIIGLRHIAPETVVASLQPLLSDRARWPKELTAAVSAGLPVAEPRVVADALNMRVIVTAPTVLMPMANEIVAQLDAPRQEGSTTETRVYSLIQASATDVAPSVQQALDARSNADPKTRKPVVSAEASSNAIVVTGAPELLAETDKIIAAIDVQGPRDAARVRTVFLKVARAEILAPLIEKLLVDDGTRQGRTFARSGASLVKEPMLKVAADARLNAVMISATPAQLDAAEEMIRQLDVGRSEGEPRFVQVLTVRNADASEIAAALGDVFDMDDREEQPPIIRVNASSNSLLVRATQAQYTAIEGIVSKLDRASVASDRQFRSVPLQGSGANAAEVAALLRRMLDSQDGGVDVITVDELLKRYESQPEGPAPSAPPASGRSHAPPRLAPLSAQIFASLFAATIVQAATPVPPTPSEPTAVPALPPRQPDAAPTKADDGVTIAVDEFTNSLLLLGSPKQIERVMKLVEQASSGLPKGATRVRAIPLPASIDAAQLATVVQQAIAKMTPSGGLPGDLAKRVAVVADLEQRALLVIATDADFESVGQLIATLARGASTERVVVRSYPLANASSARVAESFRQLAQTGADSARLRSLAVTLGANTDDSVALAFDPSKVRAFAEPGANAVTVIGSPEAIAFADRFITYIDREQVAALPTVRIIPIKNAKAIELAATLTQIYASRGRGLSQQGIVVRTPEFAADARTNSIVVGGAGDFEDLDGLITTLDQPIASEAKPLEVIPLVALTPTSAAKMIEQVVVGSDRDRRASVLVIAEDGAGVLLVRADDVVRAEIRALLKEIDRPTSSEFKVRPVKLEHADATRVADALQRLFDDRARLASGGRTRSGARTISIVGDPRSQSIFVAANDADLAEVSELISVFDVPEATREFQFRVVPLAHARAADIARTVETLLSEMGGGGADDAVSVRADERRNVLIVAGRGDRYSMIESIVASLDVKSTEAEQRVVKVYGVKNGDVDTLASLVRETLGERSPRPMEAQSGNANGRSSIFASPKSRQIVVRATAAQQDAVASLLASLDASLAVPNRETAVLTAQFVPAPELAQSLNQFLSESSAAGGSASSATVISSAAGGALLVAGTAEELGVIRDLLAKLDLPSSGAERRIEIVVLKKAQATDVARLITEQFARRGTALQGVVVTADVRTNSIVLNAPSSQFEQVRALMDRLDSPSSADETTIRTFQLTNAKAEEAVRILTAALQLDPKGRTQGIAIKLDPAGPAVQVNARIVADKRSNALVVTADEPSFEVIASVLKQLEETPAKAPIEYRIVVLKHAGAPSVADTLSRLVGEGTDAEPAPRIDASEAGNQLLIAATTEQFVTIGEILKSIDVPSGAPRVTDFIPLEHAKSSAVASALSNFYGRFALDTDAPAKQSVRIVADTGTNSLVVSAEESEWAGIRELVAKLDTEQLDASRQLRVIALVHADARGVANAINEAFHVQQVPAAPTTKPSEQPVAPTPPTQTRVDDDLVSCSADEMSNTLVVGASAQAMRRIEAVVAELDKPDYARLPPARLIPVKNGNPEQLARAIERVYGPSRNSGRDRGVRIVGDTTSNAIIVRATDEDFAQILAIAEALEQQAAADGLAVHLLPLTKASAVRVAGALRGAFAERARQSGVPLSIQVDSVSNGLVIASTGPLFEEIKTLALQLDAMAPAKDKGIFIIELKNLAPEDAKKIVESIGLDKAQPLDSSSRVVSEPIRVAAVPGRAALVIVANPADHDVVLSLVRGIDSEGPEAEGTARVVRLRNASATSVAVTLQQLVAPPVAGAKPSALATALQEQIRRLRIQRESTGGGDIALDLQKPIRIMADATSNSLLLSSTPDNVRALEEVAALFDRLPVTDAAVVRIFPLENMQSTQFARIVRELFAQGKVLGQVTGSSVTAVPESETGKALLEGVAMSTDDRTNTVIVAGKEEAVAFVEVLRDRLDSNVAIGWVEPRIVKLAFADPTDLADTLKAVLVDGSTKLPEAAPLQKQVGRIRAARTAPDGTPVAAIESEIFVPFSQLVIRAEPALRALILVGTVQNMDLVVELIKQLDVEAAAPGSLVRVYPVAHASASRIAPLLVQLFDQQIASKVVRPEDRVRAIADERTNSIVISTSPRSFIVLEELLKTLDQAISPEIREVRPIRLTNASAARLAPMVQKLLDARVDRLRRAEPETADLQRATVIADDRTNQLLVAAGNDVYETVTHLVRELDTPAELGEALVQVVPVKKANVDRIASAVNAVMARRYADLSPEAQRRAKPLIVPDTRSSSLLVAGGPEDTQAITELVNRLEALPANPAVGVHVLALASARAEQIAPRIQQLMRDRTRSLGESQTASDEVSIGADVASNSLIVAASIENLEVVRGLVDLLAKAAADSLGGRPFEVITLAKTSAPEMVRLLEEMYVTEENRRRGDRSVQVSAETRLNAVIASGSEADVQALRRLVAQLDGAKPSQVVEIKYITLQSANVIEMVGLVQSVLSGGGLTGRGGQQATILKYLKQLDGTEDGAEGVEVEVSAAVRNSISLTPDIRTNTIIVRAPRDSMELIERMIRDLDSSMSGSQNIRIFKLANADADSMARVLQELFNLKQQGNLYVLKPREPVDAVDGVDPNATTTAVSPANAMPGTFIGSDLSLVPDARQSLSVTVDDRTNSLIVAGTTNFLELVDKVVMELDKEEANTRDTFIYALKNAAAVEVARVVSQFVSEDQKRVLATLSADQLPSASKLLEREVTVVGDQKSNTVLVNASPKYLERVREIIKELDVDPPQVLIQVLLAEVSLDSSEALGPEFGGARIGDVGIAAGMGNVPGVGGSTGAPFFGSLFSNKGTPNVAIGTEDFELLINALASQSRVQVLSNPSVMVENNSDGFIQVGETVRLPDSVSFSSAGQQSSVTPEEIGILLKVRPSINPDGFVRMEIEPEISRLSLQTTQISENFESPVVTRRRATTTVTVKDGQTVVIGGLISDRFERIDTKIPFLGDIPLVGALFRQFKENSSKTELLIVLTPHVVRSPSTASSETPDTAASLSADAIDKLTLPPALVEQIRQGELRGMSTRTSNDGSIVAPVGAASEPASTDTPPSRAGSPTATPAPANSHSP